MHWLVEVTKGLSGAYTYEAIFGYAGMCGFWGLGFEYVGAMWVFGGLGLDPVREKRSGADPNPSRGA